MEYLEGVTLAERLERDGPLPLAEAEAIALQLCAAVQAIHDAGVIHRDIKSRNVMLAPRKGATQVVMMDLGLARESAVAPDGEEGLTVPGAVLGTPQYMAPEQFEGTQTTPATDIYALGVLLYEIATGKTPFRGATPMGMAVRRAKRPTPASSVREKLPRHWDAVINRCLEFDPELRYQSAKDVAEALRGRRPHRVGWMVGYAAAAVLAVAAVVGVARWSSTRGSGPLAAEGPKHLAVLPFANIGDDPANRITSDGLLETLTSRLSDLDSSGKTLWVVPASEVRQRKVTEPRDAVQQLGVNFVVTGSVQREEKGVRLIVNLVDPRSVRQVGSAVISESDGDYSALEDGAVAKLAELLRIDSRTTDSAQHPRANPAAYEQYLEAMGYLHRWDQKGNLEKAIALFEKVSQDDPTFHLGLAGLAEAYRLRDTLDHNQKWVDLALQAANRALEADPKLEPVYVTLGKVHNGAGQYELAMEEFKRALNLAPRDADAIQGMAQTYQKLGRDQEAESMFRRAIALRPDSWEGYLRLGNFYYAMSRFRDAESQYRRVLDLVPDNVPAYTNLGTVLTNENRYSEARTVLEKAVALSPTYSAYNNLANIYFLEGRYTDAAAIFEKSIRLNNADYKVWGNLAAAYAATPVLADRSRPAFEKAASLAEQKVREAPDAGVQSELGSYYAHLKMPDKARARLESAVALAPGDPGVALTVAEAYATLDDRAAAKTYLQKALTLGASPEYARRVPGLKDSFK
jgi:tetratricopeptide (TPR) repeat protein